MILSFRPDVLVAELRITKCVGNARRNFGYEITDPTLVRFPFSRQFFTVQKSVMFFSPRKRMELEELTTSSWMRFNTPYALQFGFAQSDPY